MRPNVVVLRFGCSIMQIMEIGSGGLRAVVPEAGT